MECFFTVHPSTFYFIVFEALYSIHSLKELAYPVDRFLKMFAENTWKFTKHFHPIKHYMSSIWKKDDAIVIFVLFHFFIQIKLHGLPFQIFFLTILLSWNPRYKFLIPIHTSSHTSPSHVQSPFKWFMSFLKGKKNY